ncbi:MAG: GNAT family N-acetyltransferase [Ignavibacteria bacterium]
MKSKDIKFQIAEVKDADAITALVNSVYRGENSKKGWTTEADFLEGIRITSEKVKEIIAKKSDVIILAIESDGIIGCVHLENAGMYSYLGMLSVDVNFQDKGIGRQLLGECERYTREVWGLYEVRMKVINRRVELIEYYKRRGYHSTGEIEEFGSHGETFGDTKEKLFFEVLAKKL